MIDWDNENLIKSSIALTGAGGREGRRARSGERAVHHRAAVDITDWLSVDWPVAHTAATAWQVVKGLQPLTALSLEPELYAATGMVH